MTKQKGYRVRATIFIPCDPKDLGSVRKVIDYVGTLEEFREAPRGTTVEDFSCSPGRREIPDAPNLPETHTIERDESPAPKAGLEIPAALRRSA